MLEEARRRCDIARCRRTILAPGGIPSFDSGWDRVLGKDLCPVHCGMVNDLLLEMGNAMTADPPKPLKVEWDPSRFINGPAPTTHHGQRVTCIYCGTIRMVVAAEPSGASLGGACVPPCDDQVRTLLGGP